MLWPPKVKPQAIHPDSYVLQAVPFPEALDLMKLSVYLEAAAVSRAVMPEALEFVYLLKHPGSIVTLPYFPQRPFCQVPD